MSAAYDKQIERLRKLEKRYSSLMKQSYQAAINNREYSQELRQIAKEIKIEIDTLKEQLLTH
ncbi:Lacal_2735 family protein [Nonlabens xiamenensis]|uniref:Lacal_2735 family protein n=1 Tax=Nonlabens xiamenensis TaxID=2341043 RepID=UPI0013DE0898|nr:Lacal_2735 family protein [Nonlabens xiamenensis]